MRDIVLYEEMRVLGQSPSLAFLYLEGAPLLSEKYQNSYIYLLFDAKQYSPGTSGL